MSQNLRDDSVFHKPSVPKNTGQLLSWLIFEPILLERYEKSLDKRQTALIFLKAYLYIILISITVYFMMCFITVVFDTPHLFPKQYKADFLALYPSSFASFKEKIRFVILYQLLEFVGGLAFGLAVGLALGLALGLASGLASGLAGGLAGGLTRGLASGLAGGLTVGLAGGLAGGLTVGLAVGLAGGLAFYFSYFRLYNYPFYFIRCLLGIDFYSSPYHTDALIWLPIWGVEKQFRALAVANPEDAFKFINFLREYRPLQARLADKIAHAACAGLWAREPLAVEILNPPSIENTQLKPSETWLNQLANLKTQLIAYRGQTQCSAQQRFLQDFIQQLQAFTAQTLIENRSWRDEYLQALKDWEKRALEEQQTLEEKAKRQEPITANVYLTGDALRPENNKKVFIGRIDLKETLSWKISSSPQMPLFLIQGQRRTGKTSLLNFLEQLLGSGFKVIYQDLQNVQVKSVQTLLADLQNKICHKLKLSHENPSHFPADYLSAWQVFETWLTSLQFDHHYKLILAFDEYEELHQFLHADPEQGTRLLKAMRSFSQHQNRIVFLFVGAAFFTELKNPDWGNYFVQVQTLRVDYLPPDDALRLITEPVDLDYPEALPQQMIALTQGHPALLQLLCSKMVDIANKKIRKTMSQADLDEVVQEVINDSSLAPIHVFWNQFCAEPACKATVREIIAKQAPSDKEQLNRLREHGFIVQNSQGIWQLRVPLFEQWLCAFERMNLS